MSESLPSSVQRVARALEAADHPSAIEILGSSTHTAQEAADALGVEQRQILKSMVFRGTPSNRLVVVIVGGHRQVDLARVGEELGEVIKRADPDWVQQRTGYPIGGIPPLAHDTPSTVFIDREVLGEETLWAGAGSANAMFRTSGTSLALLTGGVVADVAKR
ncbi:MAG: YbaK/EbsC family protein [Solirubrobacterales bacterium]